MVTRLDNPFLKCGLGLSQGHKVVDALVKVQEKLNFLESQANRQANGRDGEENLRNDSGRASLLPENDSPTTPQHLSLESLDVRLKLIEGKLDLVTQLLIGNLSNLQVNGPKRQVQERVRFTIHDEDVKKNLMMQQVHNSYTLNEEYAYLNE